MSPDIELAVTTLTDLTDPARERLDDARRRAETASGQLRDRGEQLVERAEVLREDLDPAVRRVRLGFWEAIRVLASSLLIVPRMMVRLLGTIAQVVAFLTGQGTQVTELAHEAAQRVPEPRGAACRRRLRASAWLGFAFGVGLGLGWLLGRRDRSDELIYDPTQPVMPVPTVEPAPVPVANDEGDDA